MLLLDVYYVCATSWVLIFTTDGPDVSDGPMDLMFQMDLMFPSTFNLTE